VSTNSLLTRTKNGRKSVQFQGCTSSLANTTEGFYWSKIFWDRSSGNNPAKQDWEWADEYIGFLKKNHIKDASPRIIDPLDNYYNAWLTDLAKSSPQNEATKQLFTDILQTNIKQIVRHCKGTIHSWTVNEILDNAGGMRDNVWMRTIGEGYVKIAIQAIRQEDPNAKVVLNDYNLETNPTKNAKMIEFARRLLNEGVLKKGDIIGIEGHQSILGEDITEDQIAKALKPFVDMGLTVRITELDAFDVFSNDASTQEKKAHLYTQFIGAVIRLNKEYRRGVADAVVLLATTHSESWQHWESKYDGKKIYPALFSDKGNREYAYYVIAKSIVKLIS
jgi:GH35 family endo-1,4-beta-xylanase